MAGSKRKIGENKYRLEYMFQGERYSQNVVATSPTEASKKLAVFVAEIEKGNYARQTSMTFVEFCQLWLDKYAKPNLSDTTIRDYKNRLNKYVLNEFGRKPLNAIKRIHIQEFANKLVEEYNLSSKTAKNYIKLISSILSKAVEWEFLQINVADKVSIPKNFEKSKKKVVLYSYEEVKSFISALEQLEDIELKIAIYTSMTTGARRAEVLALTFNDFNFEKCTVDFNKNKIAISGGTKIKETKNNKSRLFYVPRAFIQKINEYYLYKNSPRKNTPLFSMHPDTYSKNFKMFLYNNDLREINLKDLRALNESILVNNGTDVVLAAKRLGHLPSTAANYYLDQIPEEDKKSSEIINNVIFGEITPKNLA